ncbi:MAG: hypothetical protein M2R45_03194 [Verrucomicrobia subdivision 3 bacterium]|nr:hypothetical protein [Limisphaerales bacterium]MCS1413909.1 hypothetical protein [Limisphaerales bacterium]
MPYTKFIHPLTSVLNIYAANLEPIGGSLKSIDFDQTERFGVNRLVDFTWKDLLDLVPAQNADDVPRLVRRIPWGKRYHLEISFWG